MLRSGVSVVFDLREIQSVPLEIRRSLLLSGMGYSGDWELENISMQTQCTCVQVERL